MWNEKYRSRFIPAGRIGRKDFIKNILFLWVSSGLLYGSMFVTFPHFPKLSILFLLYLLFLCWVQLCLYAKRLHDVGFRAWWLVLVWVFGQVSLEGVRTDLNLHISLGLNLQTLVILAILFLMFMKSGQPQTNKFGEPV